MKKLFAINLIHLPLIAVSLFITATAFSQIKEPLVTDTVYFQVNMYYMVQNGAFNPANDTVDVAGSMNNWKGEIMQRIDTSYIYQISYVLPIASVYSYNFRICAADTIPESVDPMSRFIRVDDTTMTVTNYFNNVNPATVPMTFNCNMYYQIRAGHFSPAVDYLDVAGNFNNQGAHDVLFPRSTDSIYALTLFFDTAMVAGAPLSFKFRFNGDWATAELEGDTNRLYTLTTPTNSYTCWYNNIDPAVPSLPFVYNVSIQGPVNTKLTVTGNYNYEDYNLRPEGESIYQWYTAESTGGLLTPINSANYINYTIDSLLIGKYLVFEVKPITIDSVVGLPVQAWSPGKIVGVGLNEPEKLISGIYPNPVHDLLCIEPSKKLRSIELMNFSGQVLISIKEISEKKIDIDVQNFINGLYFLRIKSMDYSSGMFKIIKN